VPITGLLSDLDTDVAGGSFGRLASSTARTAQIQAKLGF
jgi:hypothetical protein